MDRTSDTTRKHMNIEELNKEMVNLEKQITRVLTASNCSEDDFSGVDYDARNPNDLLLAEEYRKILGKLSDIQQVVKYLNRPVKFEDTLYLRPDGRYGTKNGEIYYNSGCGIEFLYSDEILNKDGDFVPMETWGISRVEHNGTDYYIVGHKDVTLDGLRVRVR